MISRDYLEQLLQSCAQWLRLGVEMTGALVVGIGAVLALWLYVRSAVVGKHTNFNAIRLVLARYLALALEFQLAADILSTAVAPTTAEIQKLAAIAIIRTGLNYFLGKEIKEEQAAEEEKKPLDPQASGAASASPVIPVAKA